MERVSLLLRARVKAVELEARLIHGRRVASYEAFFFIVQKWGYYHRDSDVKIRDRCILVLVLFSSWFGGCFPLFELKDVEGWEFSE